MSAIRTFCSAYLDFSPLRRFDFSTFPSLYVFSDFSSSLPIPNPFTSPSIKLHFMIQLNHSPFEALDWNGSLNFGAAATNDAADKTTKEETSFILKGRWWERGKEEEWGREGRKGKEEGKQRCWSNSSDLLFRKTLGIFLRRLPFFLSENSHLKQQTMLYCHPKEDRSQKYRLRRDEIDRNRRRSKGDFKTREENRKEKTKREEIETYLLFAYLDFVDWKKDDLWDWKVRLR